MTLSDRVAALTGPDREVDALIAGFIRMPLPLSGNPKLDTPEKWAAEALALRWNVPRFTASMDAAMTLVPEGWRGRIFVGNQTMAIEGFGGPHGAFFTPSDKWEPENAKSELCWSPVLAVCAAALRARGL